VKIINGMKKMIPILLSFAFAMLACTVVRGENSRTTVPAIVPLPVKMEVGDGAFAITPGTAVVADEPSTVTARQLVDYLKPSMGFTLNVVRTAPADAKAVITLAQDAGLSQLGKEGYRLEVTPISIKVSAADQAGLFYGVQTLRQLLPANVFASAPVKDTAWTVPCVKIEDQPRFAWRGLMLDCGHDFQRKEFVLRFIDLMALHKFNLFHWHLTDLGTWSIEIKGHPELLEPATRRPAVKPGHYTQDEIREVVNYAAARHITILPEIDMPGHETPALLAYPELDCPLPQGLDKKGNPARPYQFCIGNEKTFTFLEEVLTQIVELFPGKYVHIGGDECHMERWLQCPICQARMKAENLKTGEELQSYLVKRIEKFLHSKNRRLIGWADILDGGLAPDAIVMPWRHRSAIRDGIAAAQAGHDVVMAPSDWTYLEIPQTPIEKVYSFEPISPELTAEQAKHILGAQGQMWTDKHESEELIDALVYPRAAALSEVVWSPATHRDYAAFATRLRRHLPRLEALGIKPNIVFTPRSPTVGAGTGWGAPEAAAAADTLSGKKRILETVHEAAKGLLDVDPDFAVWAQGEEFILNQLVENISRDIVARLNERMAQRLLVEDELSDLDFLGSRVLTEIERLKRNPLFAKGQTSLSVCDFGADPAGVRDTAGPLMQAIAAARTKGIHTIRFPAGRFYFNSLAEMPYNKEGEHLFNYPQCDPIKISRAWTIKAHVILAHLRDLCIEGSPGTEFMFGKNESGLFLFDCDNVIFRNLSVDYETLPFTQGRITALPEKSAYDLEIDAGFPSPLAEQFPNCEYPVARVYGAENLAGTDVPADFSFTHHTFSRVEALGGRLFRFHLKLKELDVSKIPLGTRIVYFARRIGAGSPFAADYSTHLVFDKVQIFSGNDAGLINVQRGDFLTIKNCHLGLKPGSGRMVANCADGIFLGNHRFGPFIYKTTVERQGDDYFNLHSSRRSIYSARGSNALVLSGHGWWPEIKIGERIGILGIEGNEPRIKLQAIVTNITFIRGKQDFDAQPPFLVFELDRALPADIRTVLQAQPDLKAVKNAHASDADSLIALDQLGSGMIIENCNFNGGVSRFLISARNMLFRGNSVLQSLNNQCMFVGMAGGDGTQVCGADLVSRNISICDNAWRFFGPTMGITIGNVELNRSIIPTVRHVLIQGNVMRGYRAGEWAQNSRPDKMTTPINIVSAAEVTIASNLFETDDRAAEAITIHDDICSGVVVSNNTFPPGDHPVIRCHEEQRKEE